MKTKEQIKLEIEKLQNQLKELENKITFRRFKCLPHLEVSEIIRHENKTFSEIKIPKGCRLMTIPEFYTIYVTNEYDNFLKEFKNEYNYFFMKQTDYAKKNNRVSGVCSYVDQDAFASGGRLTYSSGGGRVVFVREVQDE